MKGYTWHRIIFSVFRFLLSWIIKLKFNYSCERFDSDEPFLLIPNHNSDWDPLFVGIASKKHMYFVASEHVYRMGFVSVLLRWLVNPIARMKGGTDAQAAVSVIRTMRKGANVCLFAEGNRSFNGLTCPIFSATGKLVKSTGCKMITYKIKGGYLTTPRWGDSMRRGKMTGEVVNEYSAEHLKQLTPDQINDILRNDLYEDAFEEQENNPVAYKGKNLAHYLQTALYICPNCSGFDTIKSKGDEFWCEECGMKGAYTEFGYFEGEGVPFKTVRDWDAWQSEQLGAVVDSMTDSGISDSDAVIKQLSTSHKSEILGKGTLSLYRDRLECAGVVLPLDKSVDMALVGKSRLMMSAGGNNYEITLPKDKCIRKYFGIYSAMQK